MRSWSTMSMTAQSAELAHAQAGERTEDVLVVERRRHQRRRFAQDERPPAGGLGLHAAFVLPFEQESVLERDGDLGGDELQRHEPVGGEHARGQLVLEVEQRHDPALPCGSGGRGRSADVRPRGTGPRRTARRRQRRRRAPRAPVCARRSARIEVGTRPAAARGAGSAGSAVSPASFSGASVCSAAISSSPSRTRTRRARRAPPCSMTICRSVRTSSSRPMTPEMV